MPFATEAGHLLAGWRVERAYRVGVAGGRVGVVLSLFAAFVDFFYRVPFFVLLSDLAFLGGSLATLFYSRRRPMTSLFVWTPLYAGVWIACSTSLASTGGLQSPFLGAYLGLFCVGGMIIQNRVSPIGVVAFVFLNLIFWFYADQRWPESFGSQPPTTFTFLIVSLVLAGLLLCVFEFLKTEQNLATEILRRYEELAEAKGNLLKEEAANSAKTTFLASISHELRTPLSAIQGYAELLQDPDLSESERTQFAETIHRNGVALSRIVNDLLDLSKIEAGKFELERLEFSPRQVLEEVVELLSISAQKKNLQLHLLLRPSLPPVLISDPLRFKQILTNVIGNAIKFTEAGQVEILAQASGNNLEIEVVDTGKGLSEDEQERLFQPFTQGDASVSRKFGGTGLGLSLSRALAQLLGGELKLAWSQMERGSSFLLKLPLS